MSHDKIKGVDVSPIIERIIIVTIDKLRIRQRTRGSNSRRAGLAYSRLPLDQGGMVEEVNYRGRYRSRLPFERKSVC